MKQWPAIIVGILPLIAACGKLGLNTSPNNTASSSSPARIGQILSIEAPRNFTYNELSRLGQGCNAFRALRETLVAGTSELIEKDMAYDVSAMECNASAHGTVVKQYSDTRSMQLERVGGTLTSYTGMLDIENDLTGTLTDFCSCKTGSCYGQTLNTPQIIESTSASNTYKMLVIKPECADTHICYQVFGLQKISKTDFIVTDMADVSAFVSIGRAGVVASRIRNKKCSTAITDIRESKITETIDLNKSDI